MAHRKSAQGAQGLWGQTESLDWSVACSSAAMVAIDAPETTQNLGGPVTRRGAAQLAPGLFQIVTVKQEDQDGFFVRFEPIIDNDIAISNFE